MAPTQPAPSWRPFALLAIGALFFAGCSERKEKTSADKGGHKSADKAAASDGCTKDSECKGSRVCEKGRCVEGAPAPGTARPGGPPPGGPGPAPVAPPPSLAVPPVDPSKAPKQTACKASNPHAQRYAATVNEVIAAAAMVKGTGCVDTEALKAAIHACGSANSTGLIHAELEVPGRSACWIDTNAIDVNGRRWINISLFVGNEQAQFHGETFIYELKSTAPEAYYTGFAGDCDGSVAPSGEGASAALKADWAGLPEGMRKGFFCADGTKLP